MTNRTRTNWLTILLMAIGLPAMPARALTLAVSGANFTLNDQPVFLVGISYYAGLGASVATWKTDLGEMKRYGFNWLRVWATWSAFENDVSAVDPAGKAREPYLGRLRELIKECGSRGIAVDVTLSRGNGTRSSPNLQGYEAHRRAVETLVGALKPWRNWYLDLSNERNIRDARYTSMEDLGRLRDEVKRLDPKRLVTASHGGDISREELREYLIDAKLDFVCPHRPRDKGSAEQTEAKARELLGWMKELGRIVPVHYQEPFRRGYGTWQPGAADFLTDLRGARTGGAAGWCFHNGSTRDAKDGRPRRSFDMRDASLFKQLDAEENAFLARLGTEDVAIYSEDAVRPAFHLPANLIGSVYDAVYDRARRQTYIFSWVNERLFVRRFDFAGQITGDWIMPKKALVTSVFHKVDNEVRLLIAIGTPQSADVQIVTFPQATDSQAKFTPMNDDYDLYDSRLGERRESECRKAMLELQWPPSTGLHSVGPDRRDRKDLERYLEFWYANAQTRGQQIAANSDYTRFVYGTSAVTVLSLGKRSEKKYVETDVRRQVLSALGWGTYVAGAHLEGVALRKGDAVIGLRREMQEKVTHRVVWVSLADGHVVRSVNGMLARDIDTFPVK